MSYKANEPTAYLLDMEPAVIAGFTLSEFVAAIATVIPVFGIVFAVIGFVVGHAVIALIIGIAIGGACVVIIGKRLSVAKEGKPNGYYSLKLKVFINNYLPLGFTNKSAKFNNMRTR